MDPLSQVLRQKDLKQEHIDQLCTLFDEVEARDIRMAFDVLIRLTRYHKETQSWSFRLLATHDFSIPGSEFEADLAKRVGHRSEVLLRHMFAWGVPQLKAKVSRMKARSDWAIALTSIVLKIAKLYTHVEHSLRVATSRAALVSIHCELTSMAVENADSNASGATTALVERFQAFVAPLLEDLETATSHVEQARLFRTVKDLDRMFSSYREGHGGSGKSKSAAGFAATDSGVDSVDDELPTPAAAAPASGAPPLSGRSKPALSKRYNDATNKPAAKPAGKRTGKSEVQTVTSPLPSLFSPEILNAFETARVENAVRGAGAHSENPLDRPGPQLAAVGHRQFLKPHPPRTEMSEELKVLSVDGRMKVLHNGNYVDMQQWLDNANGFQVSASAGLGSKSGAPQLRARPASSLASSNIVQSGFLQALRRGI